ncbi:MAG: sugar-specific transcriptional regulator TrmB [Haloarculaceae archaeon]|jgi:sugar-specific transcriptional regulator TrmB
MARSRKMGPNLFGCVPELPFVVVSDRRPRRPLMSDSGDQPRAVAIEQLIELGLSTYAARTYVALVRLGEGTAEDVSAVAEVPRTRVYDAAEELHEQGLVDIQQSTPQRFWPVSAETTGRLFQRAYSRRVDLLRDALDEVEPRARPDEQRGVWTVTGRETVSERLIAFVETATDEIVFMTVEELLTDDLVEALRTASDRGVTIRLAGLSPSVEEVLQDEIPATDLFESLWSWSDTPAGRLVMVDQTQTLVSVLVEDDAGPPEPRDETAIWGTGETNSLVVVLKAMFTWQLDQGE